MDVDLGRVAEFYSEIIATCARVRARVYVHEFYICVRARARRGNASTHRYRAQR